MAPLSQEAAAVIRAWLAARAYAGVLADGVFTRFAAGGVVPLALPLSAVSARRAVRKYALQYGLTHVKLHDCRRFVGTELVRRDLPQAQRPLGHKRLETTVQH
jgi:integrase